MRSVANMVQARCFRNVEKRKGFDQPLTQVGVYFWLDPSQTSSVMMHMYLGEDPHRMRGSC